MATGLSACAISRKFTVSHGRRARKRRVKVAQFGTRKSGFFLEQAAIDFIPELREKVMKTEDAAEGIRSFIERRAAKFQGR